MSPKCPSSCWCSVEHEGMIPINHPASGFLYSGIPKWFIPFLIPYRFRTSKSCGRGDGGGVQFLVEVEGFNLFRQIFHEREAEGGGFQFLGNTEVGFMKVGKMSSKCPPSSICSFFV